MVNRIIGIIGWIGTGLVFGAVAVRMLGRPEWLEYARWGAWAGLACILVYMAGQWRDVKTFYAGRSARYGTMSIVGVLVFLGIIVAVNYLAVRQNKRWDLTANQFYSLSEQTTKILQSLDAPLKITVFDKDTEFDRFRDRLDEYAYQSRSVSVEYVDADREPDRTRAAQVQAYGTIVIEYKGKTERITSNDEQSISNGIIKAMTGEARKIYFTQGHGEKDPTSQDRTGYGAVANALTRDNYAVERIVLAQQPDVPADATAVIVAGPRTDFLQPELDALKRYLARGGKVMVLMDPPQELEGNPTPLITAFLKEWAIDVGNDVVLDTSGMGQLIGANESVPVAVSYPSHPITTGFELMTAYPLARSVRPVEGGVGGKTAQPVVQTSERSWAETNLKGLASGTPAELNADQGDRPGPVPLGAAVSAPATDVPPQLPTNTTPNAQEPPKPETRIVAFGDSDFAANYGLGIQGNRNFFLNAVNWVSQNENLIAIRPRESEDRRITLTSDQHQRIVLMSLLIVPGLVFATGIYTWWRRRKA